ncbi:MAG TPA: hypothetical protein VFM88_05815 [Vicinamibacteria bacterium]|nr:hypothetical protein [Vicinamibacteria bacterium]
MSRSARLVLVCLLGAGPPVAGASFPPGLRFRTLETPEVVIHYHDGLEGAARVAASLGTQVMRAHEGRSGVKVRPVHVVLADTTDDPNGFATPLPYPLVHIRAVAPDGTDEFGNHDGWLRLVLTHELAHVVHLEQARGVIAFGRKLLGRAPYLFPNGLTPPWLLEGLATYEETEGTAFGRGRNPDVRMVRRVAALAGALPKEDQATTGLDAWPGGIAAYFYGEAFLRELEEGLGEGTLPALAREHSGRIIPYTDELTAHSVTGASFHARFKEWRVAEERRAVAEGAGIWTRGVTASRPLTARGIRQLAPRFSPDGVWIAYTSGSLDRYRAIRLVLRDGSADRELVRRNGGSGLAWTPDGRSLVFDEPEAFRVYSTFSDLRVADVATGAVRQLTRGLRARDPDVAPDGRRVAFVKESGGHAELATIALDGTGLRGLTASEPGTQWSGPRFSRDGRSIVASRLLAGGLLDVVLVDPVTGAVTPLTSDRAKDVEPTFTPDGRFVVFRSDRDGVSNLYALRLADRALLRVTSVVGGAFTPDVAPDGRGIAFSDYSFRGFDVHLMDVNWNALAPVAAFEDRLPPSRSDPEPWTGPDRPYRPLPALLPRFWSPYFRFGDDGGVGAVTGGVDPLFRHAYGLSLFRAEDTGRLELRGVYQYDRWRPTLLAVWEDTSDALVDGGVLRNQELTLRASLPVLRRVRHSQSLSLAYRRRAERADGAHSTAPRLDLGGLEAEWSFSSARSFPFSISPVEGVRARVAFLREAEALGSDVSLGKLTADLRGYRRVFGSTDALAVRLGGGTTFGEPGFDGSYVVGGFPDSDLLDVAFTNETVLRGYPDDAYRGRSFAHANLEYRFPLGHPQRGFWSFPVFLRHLHGSIFADAASAWSGPFRIDGIKPSAGAALGADLFLGHGLAVTTTAGVARGFASGGETRAYFRAGLAF